MNRARSLILTIVTVGLGGAAGAIAAYSVDHPAEYPAILGALVLAAREVSKYLDSRDSTRQ